MNKNKSQDDAIDVLLSKESLSSSEAELLEAWAFFAQYPYLKMSFVRLIIFSFALVGVVTSLFFLITLLL
jgi:hypothetical protein